VPSGGLTCKITRGSFFATRELTTSLSDADTEVLGIGTGVSVSLLGLLATSGVLLFLESFLRSRRVLDVGGTQFREGCGGVRYTSIWESSSEVRVSHGSGSAFPSEERTNLRALVAFSSYNKA
jgi:hypothetical protein